MILGIHKSSIYRYMQNGELHVCGTDQNRIMRLSFNALVQKIIMETEIKLRVMKNYISKNQDNFNVMAAARRVPDSVACETKIGTRVPDSVARETKIGTQVPDSVAYETKMGTDKELIPK